MLFPLKLAWTKSRLCLAHAGRRLRCRAGSYLLFDSLTYVGIDALPVRKRTFKHRAAHAAQQSPGDRVDKARPLGVVEHFSDQCAGLDEIVVIGPQGIGCA